MAAGPERSAATMVAALGAMGGLPGEVRRRVCEEAWWWDLRAPLRTALSGAGPPRAPHAAEGSFLSVAWSPDGRQLAAGCGLRGTEDGSGAISVWDVASGPAPTRACLNAGDHDPDVVGILINATKGKPPCGCESTVDEDTGEIYSNAQGCPLPGHAVPVVALAFSPDGTTLLSASSDFTVRLWGRMSGPSEAWEQTGCLLAGGPPTEDESGYRACHVAWSPDGSRVLACMRECGGGAAGRRVHVWEVPGPGQPPLRPSLELHLQPSSKHFVAAFSPGGGGVVASDGTRLIRWDLAAGGKTTHWQEWPMEGADSDDKLKQGVGISPDTSHVAVIRWIHPNPIVAVWSVGEAGVERAREIRTGQTRYWPPAIAISPDNQYVLVATIEASEMWSVQTGRRVWEVKKPARRGIATDAPFSPDGRSFAIASGCAPVELWR